MRERIYTSDTFGKEASAIHLAHLIREHPNSRMVGKKISSMLEKINVKLNESEKLSSGTYVLVSDLLIKNFEETLRNNPTIGQNEKMVNTMLNIVKTKRKTALKEFEND